MDRSQLSTFTRYIVLTLIPLSIPNWSLGEESEPSWKKHVVMDKGHCNTAVALDANGDQLLDVIASFQGKVSLFLAPNWSREVVLLSLIHI